MAWLTQGKPWLWHWQVGDVAKVCGSEARGFNYGPHDIGRVFCVDEVTHSSGFLYLRGQVLRRGPNELEQPVTFKTTAGHYAERCKPVVRVKAPSRPSYRPPAPSVLFDCLDAMGGRVVR